jgi:hypothetical protein
MPQSCDESGKPLRHAGDTSHSILMMGHPEVEGKHWQSEDGTVDAWPWLWATINEG